MLINISAVQFVYQLSYFQFDYNAVMYFVYSVSSKTFYST